MILNKNILNLTQNFMFLLPAKLAESRVVVFSQVVKA